MTHALGRRPASELTIPNRFVREALLQAPIDHRIRCDVCERRCQIVPGGLGWCRTRANRDGKLVTLIYGAVSSLAVNPIEKKPFYHFHPGTQTLTAGSWSCNFGCPWCQNWDISKVAPPLVGDSLAPAEFVLLTRVHGCRGTSISFNEPTLPLGGRSTCSAWRARRASTTPLLPTAT